MAIPVSAAGLGSGPEGELAALDDLADRIDENAGQEHRLAGRIRGLRSGRAAGRSWTDLFATDSRPAVVQSASSVVSSVSRLSGSLRRLLARGLRDEGAPIPAIAEKFGVTRQRVSTLLRP